MLVTPIQKASYLLNQRQFPYDELKSLAHQVDQAYIDIASKVNKRIIGTYALNFLSVTGEKWFFKGSSQPQQSLRQIYTFTGAGDIPHGLTWVAVSQISARSYGSFTDGTNWYGVIYAGSTAIPNQVSFYITDTYIVILSGALAPTIVNGTIVLEYISNF
jgi:hypothetical protein